MPKEPEKDAERETEWVLRDTGNAHNWMKVFKPKSKQTARKLKNEDKKEK